MVRQFDSSSVLKLVSSKKTKMVIGVITWDLEILGAQSLKEKRSVVKSLKDRLHDRFNISAAETAHHDLWQRAQLTAAVVATDGKQAESVLQEANRPVENEHRARIISATRRWA